MTTTENQNQTNVLYLIFKVADNHYATLAENILEITRLHKLTVFEKMDKNLIGLMEFRNKIINVLNIKTILGINTENTTHDNTQILVININNKTYGLAIDEIIDITQLSESDIHKLPYKSDKPFITGLLNIKDHQTAILNIEEMINHSNIKIIEQEEPSQQAEQLPEVQPVQIPDITHTYDLQNEEKEYRFISFSLGEHIYCLSLKYVKEFAKMAKLNITQIPYTPDFFKGIVNIRGEFINIIDIKPFLGINSKNEISQKSKIIVINSTDLNIGIIVDEVFDMINISSQQLQAENSLKFEKNKFILSELVMENNKVISIINIDKLLKDNSMYVG